MNATSKLLEWAAGRPAWQQDALRRLAVNRSLSEQDLDDLLAMLKAEHNLVPPDKAPKPVPLAVEHLPDTASHGDEVALVAVSNVQNAMRLKPGETLAFSPEHLTLIYGDTGSGKSGYARILKRATRARGQEARILPDVYANNYRDTPPASAKIHLTVMSDGSSHDEVLDWEDGEPGPNLLARVRVFDNRAAAVYVNERCDVQFEPLNLDLLPFLAQTCDALRERVEAEKVALEARWRELSDSIPNKGTVHAQLQKMSAETTAAEIEKATTWSAKADGARLKELEDTLKDAVALAASLRRRKDRCENLGKRLAKVEAGLSDDAAENLRKLRTDAAEKREAASKLSQKAFEQEPLDGVGEGPWRVMWDAAKEYSIKAAYPDKAFPVIDADDVRCVLCQQELGAEATDRLERFRQFMEGEVARLAEEAEEIFGGAQRSFTGLDTAKTAEDRALVEEIEAEDEGLAQAVADCFDVASKRKEALLGALANGDFSALVPAPTNVSAALLAYAKGLEGQAQAISGALQPSERAKLESEYGGLLGRKTLAEHEETVERLVAHKAEVAKLDACRKGLNPKGITDAKKALERDLLLKPFENALQEELKLLDMEQKVTLGFSGERATTYHKTQFVGTDYSELAEVLSDGEHRAVALACFLAEARQLPGLPPLIIDDPVSSLDNIRHEKVAKRLLREAQQRQVIVFTHDLVFYTELMALAADEEVPVRPLSLMRVPEGYGHVDPSGVPWPMKKLGKRLHHLESEKLPALRKLYKKNDPKYPETARDFGEKLRETWERLVEEVLFADVVTRYRRSVKTQRLQAVYVDTEAWKAIHRGITRTSMWAHDQPATTGDAPPTPDDLKDEIDKIRACEAQIKGAQKDIREQREKFIQESTTGVTQVRSLQPVAPSGLGPGYCGRGRALTQRRHVFGPPVQAR